VARASPAVVSEILDVLLSNALRHGAGAVTVRLRRREGTLAVDVADEGAGLTGDPEPAFARRGGSGDGHGIGLALARSLAHAERGSLTVEGVTFTLLLPAA
jgi:signal transduction histidine kinase